MNESRAARQWVLEHPDGQQESEDGPRDWPGGTWWQSQEEAARDLFTYAAPDEPPPTVTAQYVLSEGAIADIRGWFIDRMRPESMRPSVEVAGVRAIRLLTALGKLIAEADGWKVAEPGGEVRG